MSTDILDHLSAVAAPVLAARAEIERLRAQLADRSEVDDLHQRLGAAERERAAAEQHAHEVRTQLQQVEQQLAELSAEKGGAAPGLPRQRKFNGTAYNLDGEAMTRTDTEMEVHGCHCYALGIAEGRRSERKALRLPPREGGPTREQWDREAKRRNELRGG
jgi:hypothetical protein